MSLVWKNVYFEGQGSLLTNCIRGCCCVCCLHQPESHILSQLNGEINLRELTALMGPSGAGKSTLLKCITQGENYTGFRGELLTDVEKVRASFITQVETDHLLHNLKVFESVWYASEIKNPTINRGERGEIVDNLLRQMRLGASSDNLVEQCSGGEKKRIAIALELTSRPKPNFLFLDEPLSGLDSSAGKQMVIMLRELAISQEMAIVATIHQPSLEIFGYFHKAYVVSKEGKCIFSGRPDSLRNHLRTNDYAITDECNPADAIIEIGAAVERGRNEENADDGRHCWCWAKNGQQEDGDIENALIVDTDRNTAICRQMSLQLSVELLNQNNVPRAQHRAIQEDGLCKNSANFSFWKLWVLFKRSCWTSLFRQRKLIFIRFLLHSVVAAVLAGLYNRDMGLEDGCYATNSTFDPKNCSCVESEEEMRNESVSSQNVKFHFFSLLFLMFAALMPTVLTFPAEIKLFLNEHRNGWYNTISYYISKTIIEIPFQLVFPYFYTYFLYWFSQQLGMDEWYGGFLGYMTWRYSYFLGVTLISCFIAQGLGFLIGIICVNSFNITVVLSSSVLLFLFLFSGFFVKTMQMGAHVQWITYLSFIRFSFESLLIIIYGFKRCEFLPGPEGQQVPVASAILYIFDLKDEDLLVNLYWLIGHLITTRVLAFIVLKHFADPKFLRPKWFIPDCVQFAINEASALSLCCRKLTRWFLYVLKFCAALFLIQLAVGIVIIGIQALRENLHEVI